MDFLFHPSLLPALCLAAISVAVAAVMRRFVRKEYPSLLPWLLLWGALCMIPALMFALLCLPGFGDAADWLNESIAGTWIEVLAGIAGILPGLLWDEAKRIEQNRPPLFGMPATTLRALLIAALTIVILIPYGFLFNRQYADVPVQETPVPVQTETISVGAPVQTDAVPDSAPVQPEDAPDSAPAQPEAVPDSAPAETKAAPAESPAD